MGLGRPGSWLGCFGPSRHWNGKFRILIILKLSHFTVGLFRLLKFQLEKSHPWKGESI